MRKIFLLVLIQLCCLVSYSQKTIYIPTQFSDAPWNEWSYTKSYQSTNFIVFWGNKVGTDPANYADATLRFVPADICSYLEASFSKFVTDVGFVSNASTKKLGQYKIIIVMNDTYSGANGPSGWAFGGQYDGMIGAMWVNPGATKDPYVLSHEFAHTLQAMNTIQENTVGGGFNDDTSGFFWEAHANYMRCIQFPQFASDDLPRWTATSNFHLSSTRHHYSTFKWLMHIQQSYGGTNMVNRLWRESVANEHPVVTFSRLNSWTQSQLNDFMYDYAKREVIGDYPAQGFGAYMRTQRNIYKTTASENHYQWRVYTMLNQISATTGRFSVPDHAAPQDYGFNIIPLYTTCASKSVHVKFKGHTEVNSTAGWRWGFVAVKADGTTVRYSALSSASDGEASFTMAADETQLFLVVVGAPTTHTSYVWEPGWPRIKRYPYELRIENAVPEGYQSTYRSDIQALFAGHAHSNGGGWIANTATVASSVFVGPKAVVVGSSNLSGTVTVNGTSRLESVTASGSVAFNGDVNVYGGTYSNTAQVLDRAILNNCTVSGNAIIKGNALEWGTVFGGTGVVIGGDDESTDCSTAGVYLQFPHPNNGRDFCDGKGAGDASNTDVNAAYTQFTDAQMSWTIIGCGSDTQAPTVPGTPTASNITSTGVTLTWTASTDNVAVSGYDVLQNGTVVQTVTGATAAVTGLSASTAYSFTIKAKDAAGNASAASGATSVTTSAATATGPVAGTIYKITARHSGKSFCMRGGTGSTGNNIQLTQYVYQSGAHQQFKVEANGSYFRLTPQQATDKALDVTGNSTADAANIIQYTWSSSATNQQWSFVSVGSGYYQIKSRSSNKCLGVASASTADDANVQQFTCNTSTTSQHFSFEAITGARFATEPVVEVTREIVVYPNPAKTSFTVELKGFDPKELAVLRIVDLQGKEVLNQNLGETRKATYQKSVLNMKESIYIIHAQAGKKTVTIKLITNE